MTPDDAEVAARAAAKAWDMPDPQLLRLGMNAVFGAGDAVLRVSEQAGSGHVAIELAEVLRSAKVRAPRAVVPQPFVHGSMTVTGWERLHPVDDEVEWREVGEMAARVHALSPGQLPAGGRLPPCEAFPWWQFDELLAEVGVAIDAPARAGIDDTLERHGDWVERIGSRVVCHGDLHPDNVMMTTDGPVLLDWDLLCVGPPAWDHASLMRLVRWGWPARWYDTFAAGYGRSMVGDPLAESIAELRLVAASLMRLRAGLADPAAMGEAQARLAYWRDPAHAPPWTPT